MAIEDGEGLYGGSEAGDDGGSDEDGFKGFFEALDGDEGLERVDLGAEGVSSYGDVEEAEGVLGGAGDALGLFEVIGKEDEAHAGSPDGHALSGSVLDGLAESVSLEEESDGGALAAGDHEALDLVKLVGGFDEPDLIWGQSRALEGIDVFVEVALDSEDSDGGFHGKDNTRACSGAGGDGQYTICIHFVV